MFTPETRAKISAKLRGRKLSDEHRKNLAAAMTPERRAKISAAMRARVVSAETRAKLSAASWKGGRTTSRGHVLVLRKDHPFANATGYVQEHRLVMEGILGRYLTRGEKVHHLNGIKDDNRPENLAVLIVTGPHAGWVLCPHCQKNFMIR